MEENATLEEIQDHLLVRYWLMKEGGGTLEEDHCLSTVNPKLRQQAERELLDGNWMRLGENDREFTKRGTERAEELIRRHRLAECLFSVVLNLSEESVRQQACLMEHDKTLTPEAVEGICAFLGHPPSCPHGRLIPSGNCCRLFVDQVRPLVIPFSQATVGEDYQIVFLTPRYHQLLEQLSGFGVAPGARVRFLQKYPSMILKVHETEVALDTEIAGGIYVKRL